MICKFLALSGLPRGRGPLLANSTSSTEMRHPPVLSLPTLTLVGMGEICIFLHWSNVLHWRFQMHFHLISRKTQHQGRVKRSWRGLIAALSHFIVYSWECKQRKPKIHSKSHSQLHIHNNAKLGTYTYSKTSPKTSLEINRNYAFVSTFFADIVHSNQANRALKRKELLKRKKREE